MGFYADTAFGLTHCVDHGGNGGPVVLIHGLGGSTANWEAVAGALTAHGAVSAIDLPGFGLSPPGRDFRLGTHCAALEAYIEHLGRPATLIGNSTGALISEMVASRRPDLVANLVLIAPATPPVLPDRRLDWPTVLRLAVQTAPVAGPAMSRWLLRKTPMEIVNLSLSMVTHHPGRVPMAVIEESIEIAAIRRHYPWAELATARTARSIAGIYLRRRRFVDMIRAIQAPTVVIQGIQDDIVSPTAVEWLSRLRPDWDLIQMVDTGHTPMMDAPLRTLEVLEPWLARRYFAP
jgi:pimeloyl-ACP methyl ester carboxylesterase